MLNLLAIITARGGSKTLPGKNIKPLCGIPLIAYSIQAANGCSDISRCIVSTDDDQIAEVSKKFGAEVIMRPHELATDTSSSQDAVQHVLSSLLPNSLPEYFILLQPTSPLRTTQHLCECISLFKEKTYNSCISVCEPQHHPYKAFVFKNSSISALFDENTLSAPRQNLPHVVCQNGAIYIVRTSAFLERNSFYIPPVMPYFMDTVSSVDIDTATDFQFAEMIMKKRLENILINKQS